ncbi:helix-turn-helix domain-containing protein [Kitasatospora cathayae]|uniref:Helix-turn-helix transcriptional regulator n=1 Tax=Kitasatospora cathayae TaxID=3004092 RepID=A0ABY7Q561_9ACTN|nr:helix-turn-helix transcriptional regulator [Kitasatospora sp. HUAS 3-15]WBP87366.1 helix-turn-helix transcriptional regulator [Kitasatospora sp. HUAS 3-15]
MALRTQISERQRRFGAELRRLREAAGLAVKDAGALIGIVGPQLSHIEAARTSLDPERLSVLLDAYGCTDKTYIALLRDLGASDGKGWWTEYKGKVPPLALDLAEAECRAIRLHSYDSLYIPGVLQLPDYAMAIYEGALGSPWAPETQVRFRMDRQRILNDDKQFSFVIHEAALRMRFAGDAAMRAQLLHLLDMAEMPNISIQVLPFTAPKHAPLSASFLFCDPGCRELSTIILSGPKRAEHLGDPIEVDIYARKFQQLSELALPPADRNDALRKLDTRDSWGLIHHVLYELQT